MLLAKRIIAGFNLERPQEVLTAHQWKGWPVRSRALPAGSGGRMAGSVGAGAASCRIASGRVRTLRQGADVFSLSYCALSAPREGGGGDTGDLKRKEGTRDIAVTIAKQQLGILGSVKYTFSEEFVEAWCPFEFCHHGFSKTWDHSAASVPAWTGGELDLRRSECY